MQIKAIVLMLLFDYFDQIRVLNNKQEYFLPMISEY